MKFLRIMGACFLVAGAGVFIAEPILRVMGGAWFVVGLILVAVAQKVASSEANRQRLLATGKAGQATVLEVHDTGITVNNSPRVRLKVRIDVAGEAPIEATHAMMVSRVGVPRAGEVYDVRFDPKDPNNFTFAPSEPGSYHRGSSRSTSESSDTISKLERLAALHSQGVLSQEEFEQQKRKLLAEG